MNAHTVLVIAAGLFLAACGATTPQRLDAQMGTAADMAKAQQTLNPQASSDTRPVVGIDGKAANALVDRYHRSFTTPQPTVNVYTIGVGSGSGSSGGSSASR